MKKSLLVILCLAFCVNTNVAAQYADGKTRKMPRYDLSIKILPDSQRLEVTGTIQLPAANINRDSLELSLRSLIRYKRA